MIVVDSIFGAVFEQIKASCMFKLFRLKWLSRINIKFGLKIIAHNLMKLSNHTHKKSRLTLVVRQSQFKLQAVDDKMRLTDANVNLRDNMTNVELELNILTETSETEITNEKDPSVFWENKVVTKESRDVGHFVQKLKDIIQLSEKYPFKSKYL